MKFEIKADVTIEEADLFLDNWGPEGETVTEGEMEELISEALAEKLFEVDIDGLSISFVVV